MGKRKFNWKKWLIVIAGIIAALALVAFIGFTWFMNKSKPVIDGELAVTILDQDVTVTRDEKGVPHIFAKTDADLYRAQGYVQAQDRLFQMDLARRQASGRLSEIIGEATINTDKHFRTFSLRDAAEKSLAAYDDESKQVLEWYAEGVNAFIAQAKESNTLSYEFALLGYEPEEWTVVDSLTIGKYMAYDLGGNWNTLAFRHWALQNFDEEKAKELFIKYPENASAIIEANIQNPVAVAGQFSAEMLPNEFNGSNNWVVSGDKTKSGTPILADDPHLGLSTPSIWYQMHLQSPQQNVSGVIFAGIPGIILGHNDEIAWGVTNVGPDVQDLYIEIPNPDNPTQFRYDGKWEQAEVRDESIKVKDGETVDFEVVVTRHGPIMTDLAFKDTEPTAQFSMQWTALQPTAELRAVLGFNKAKTWGDFEKALEDFKAPAQNFVFASKDGTIAYKANGQIPIRKQGEGQLPVPGDSSDYGWKGFIPWGELPTLVNPKEGFIATANNQVIGEDYPYHITDFWAQPYRFERIKEVLEANDAITVEDMMALQMDQHNLYAREFLPDLLTSLKEKDQDGKYAEVMTMLEKWDMVDAKESGAPLVFHTLMIKLQEVLFKDQMPEDMYGIMYGKFNITDQLLRTAYSGEKSIWIEEQGGIDETIYKAFELTIAQLEDQFGKNSSKWQWGDYHQLTFDHTLGSASPILAAYFNAKKVPIGGSKVTVQAADNDLAGNVDHGASWRFVVDVGDLSSAYHIVGPGQSGHVKSDWYQDQVLDWANGDYHQTFIKQEEIKGKTLQLIAK
ncbi:MULTISPECIES: penicillin acylase family protein [Lysinibacillus]|uniref:penicillin acylase family protein n=1 Tax=Lysinibacillus TaxID=400634 RepID=UPI0021A5C959|nr:penicillin acylase family protein [Lysinibacillus capsici]MCT1539925.1 penicillin acylase family protein [Lysinibacillus capsici]MCT1571185.1 penicillin acylase family protein [Lysinibacillus capsici]MCT1648398.1 penicillin acylase family protein [Lysinibacillus capsici]MCT1726940.1 penicillin acylase family protein [Lysinibacillus capsici]MCT1784529.1 penicillin acylase family protein [Lysinibacillus capsici]